MKKLYTVLVIVLVVIGGVNAQCTINAAATPGPGIFPAPNQLPCIIVGQPYDETVQVQAMTDTTITILIISGQGTLDSIRVDSIIGLPAGIAFARSPEVLYGGENGCLRFSGTTNDAVKNYNLTWIGVAWVHITSPIDTHIAYNGNLSRFQFSRYYLSVINPGDVCHPFTGINNFSGDLNAALNVYPNPNNGSFEVKLDAGQRVNGEINVLDMTGKKVYNQPIDIIGQYNTSINLSDLPKGLYTVQVKSETGVASKNISIQ